MQGSVDRVPSASREERRAYRAPGGERCFFRLPHAYGIQVSQFRCLRCQAPLGDRTLEPLLSGGFKTFNTPSELSVKVSRFQKR